jgi:hypothetical protein
MELDGIGPQSCAQIMGQKPWNPLKTKKGGIYGCSSLKNKWQFMFSSLNSLDMP